MVYIYMPAAYYHLNLDVTKENLLAEGFSAVPAVFLVVIVSKGFYRLGGSVQSPYPDPRYLRQVNGALSCNGDLCNAKCHLAKYCRRNVMFGLIGKRITCLVRIKYFRRP